jgi:hypothetical protein
MSNKGCILKIRFLACFIDTFPVGGGNTYYKATSVAIAIAGLTEVGKIDPPGQGGSPNFFPHLKSYFFVT